MSAGINRTPIPHPPLRSRGAPAAAAPYGYPGYPPAQQAAAPGYPPAQAQAQAPRARSRSRERRPY